MEKAFHNMKAVRVKRENQDIVVLTKDILQSNVELKFSTEPEAGPSSSTSNCNSAGKVMVNIEEHNTEDMTDITYSYGELMEDIDDLRNQNDGTDIYITEQAVLEQQLEGLQPEVGKRIVCRHETKDKQTVLCHIKSNDENKIYKCIHCHFQTDDECALVEHGDCRKNPKVKVKAKPPVSNSSLYPYDSEEGPRIYRCSECDFQSIIRARFKQHMKMSKHLTDWEALIEEERTLHRFEMNQSHFAQQMESQAEEPVTYKCGCRFETNDHDELMQHFQEKHVLPKIYKCTRCNFQSLVHARFRDHMKKQHGKICPEIPHVEAGSPNVPSLQKEFIRMKATKPGAPQLTPSTEKNYTYLVTSDNQLIRAKQVKGLNVVSNTPKLSVRKLKVIDGNKIKKFEIVQDTPSKQLVAKPPVVTRVEKRRSLPPSIPSATMSKPLAVSTPKLGKTYQIIKVKKEKHVDENIAPNVQYTVQVPETVVRDRNIQQPKEIMATEQVAAESSSSESPLDSSQDHNYCKSVSPGKDLLQCALDDIEGIQVNLGTDQQTNEVQQQFEQHEDVGTSDPGISETEITPEELNTTNKDVPIVYKCTKCEYISNDKTNFEDHLQKEHNIETFSYKYHIQKVKCEKSVSVMSDQKEVQPSTSKKIPDRIKRVLKNETASILEEAKKKRRRRNSEQMVYPIIYHCAECNFQTIVQSSFAHHIETKHYEDATA